MSGEMVDLQSRVPPKQKLHSRPVEILEKQIAIPYDCSCDAMIQRTIQHLNGSDGLIFTLPNSRIRNCRINWSEMLAELHSYIMS
jgi:hypothetical protein